MIKRARTARDFLDTSQSSTLERRSREEEQEGGNHPLLALDFNEDSDYPREINFLEQDVVGVSLTAG